MLLGGLEIVAGSYLIHRHHRRKNERQRLEDEARQRRNNSFPGAPGPKPPSWNTQAHYRPQQQQQQQQQPPLPDALEQKYCYAYSPSSPTSYHYAAQPRPQQPLHTQSFSIPRRPVPPPRPAIIIQPSLQRTDSCATISRMQIADGSRPSNMPEYEESFVRPSMTASGGLQTAPLQTVYSNSSFSMSTPALGATPTSPALTYVMATEQDLSDRYAVDDNWQPYEHNPVHPYYEPSVSTDLGEQDPPPPYRP